MAKEQRAVVSPGTVSRREALGWGLVLGLLCALPVLRLHLTGIQPYGTDGAEYIEHLARLQVRESLRTTSDLGIWARLVGADAEFPPGMHLLSMPWAALWGGTPTAVAGQGAAWLAGLAAVTGGLASRLGGARAGWLAAVLLAALPAFQGAATRYYYDLPMTVLLWGAAAALVLLHRRVALAAGVAGAAFALACLVKWSAIPHGVPILVFAAATSALAGARWRTALPVGAVATAMGLGFSWLYLGSVEGSSSFVMQRAILEEQDPILRPWLEQSPELRPGLIALSLERLTSWTAADLAFYPLKLVVSVLSPLVAALVALGCALAVRARSWPAVTLALGVGASTAGFLLLLVPVLDDRFLVPALPALVACAAVGLARVRSRAGLALAGALLLAVALEFHTSPAGPHNAPVVLLDSPGIVLDSDDSSGEALPRAGVLHKPRPSVVARGLFGASSVGGRGWTRGDEQPPSHPDEREALWAAVDRLQPACVGISFEVGAVGAAGDYFWWRERSLRSVLEDKAGVPPPTFVPLCRSSAGPATWSCEAQVIVLPRTGQAEREVARCLDRSAFDEHPVRGTSLRLLTRR